MSLLQARSFVVFLLMLTPLMAQLPGRVVPFPPALQAYLELSASQVNAIVLLNGASQQFVSEKLRRSVQVQIEIAQETTKPTLDAMALGLRYVELEAIRREIAADQQKTYSEVQKVLTEPQKTKVQALVAAMRMQGLICEAQSQHIIGAPLPGNRLPPVLTPGPGGVLPGGIIGSILPPGQSILPPFTCGTVTPWFSFTGSATGQIPAQP
jgi:hypothetical protein